MKQRIILTEGDLHRIVKESVRRILKEGKYENNKPYFTKSKTGYPNIADGYAEQGDYADSQLNPGKSSDALKKHNERWSSRITGKDDELALRQKEIEDGKFGYQYHTIPSKVAHNRVERFKDQFRSPRSCFDSEDFETAREKRDEDAWENEWNRRNFG
jgi:hypothetical protein